MRRLRLHFATFFSLLSITLGFLLWHTYRQIDLEERELWRGQAEKIYNQMQAAVSDLLTAEDRRPFNEYRFTNDLDERPAAKQPTPASPIAQIPSGDARGLVGYFQIDADGVFSTPYLPRNWPDGAEGMVPDGEPRRSLQNELEEIASSLKSTVPGTPAKKGYVELGKLDTAQALKSLADQKNVYPNPIQEQAARYEEKRAKAKSFAKTKDKAAVLAQTESDALMENEKPREAPAAPAPPAAAPAGASGASRSSADVPASRQGRRFVEPRLPDDTVNLAIDVTGITSLSGNAGLSPPSADPFQARLVNERYLLFYRKVWRGKEAFVQGFAVELRRFYEWLMEQTFANSEFPDFALTRLEVTDTPVAQYGLDELDISAKSPFFVRALGYPLNRFEWKVYVDRLPRVSTRLFLNILSGILSVLVTAGLYLIYRASASQVAYSQKRQDFVSAVTHELKTPLTSIRMYSELLEDGWAKDPDKLKEYYGHISKESGRLSRLIENVLQLARLEKKTYKLALKKEHPSADFKEIAEELRKMAERQGFTMTVENGPAVPPIIYDPEAVKQILLTLLDNSMKFSSVEADPEGASSRGKSLEIALIKEKDEVVFCLRDRGPGIPPSDLKKVFLNFYRVENELTRKTKGTGIGLAMSRMLAEAMAAHIEARNRSGGGLEVRLVFKVFR